MIFRRVAASARAHLRKQAWTAVAIDFVIVVLGVFIGIQLSNWNADRIQRAQERDFLVRLHEDFEQSLAGQKRDLDFLDQQLADQAVILKSLDARAVAPADAQAFERGVNTLGNLNPPRLYRRTIDEMAASGETDVLRSATIKAQLAEVVALVEFRGNVFAQVARRTEHYRFLVEERTRYDLTRVHPDPLMGEVVGVDYDIDALGRDPAIASAVSAISVATRDRRRAYLQILERYTALLPMLEDELSRRWGVGPVRDTAP